MQLWHEDQKQQTDQAFKNFFIFGGAPSTSQPI